MAEPPTLSGRAAAAGMHLLGRGIVVRLLGLFGLLVVAGQLGPSDFGRLALGYTILATGSVLGDIGFTPSLIRQPETPRRAELRCALALQLLLGAGLTAVAGVLALLDPHSFGPAAVLVGGLMLVALTAPYKIMLERELRFGPVARADIASTTVGTAAAVAAAVAGAPVTVIALTFALRPLLELAVLVPSAGLGLVGPRLDAAILRSQIAFNATVGAAHWMHTLRDQGLNLLVASVGGFAALGAWSIVARLQQVPNLLFEVAARVTLPFMARYGEQGGQTGAMAARTARLAGSALGLATALIVVAMADLLPRAFGDEWSNLLTVAIVTTAASLIYVPVATGFAGALLAAGEVSRPLTATVAGALVTLGAGAAALAAEPTALAAAAALLAGLTTEVLVLRPLIRERLGVDAIRGLLPVWVISAAAGAAGLAAQDALAGWVGTVTGMAVAVTVFLAGAAVALRPVGRDLRRLVAAGRGALPRPTPQAP